MKTLIAFGNLVGIGAAVLIACGGEAGSDPSMNESASNAPSSSHSSSPSAARGMENDELAVTGMAPRGPSVDAPSAGADASASPNYFSCQTDSDCVAVKYFEDCCYNGLEIAVASSEAAAYESATECTPVPPHVCPLFIIRDTQVPACVSGQCEMVNPPDGGSTLPVATPDAGAPADDAGACDDAMTPQAL